MSNTEIKNLRDDLFLFIVNKKNEIVPVQELSLLYDKYVKYQNLEKIHNQDERKILYFLLEKLYVANCTDLDLISAVIKRMHTEGIWFNNIISDLFNESKNFETDEIIQLFEYCLKYVYMKKLLFNGFRMAKLSKFFTLLFPDAYYTSHLPDVIGILLRYGMLLDTKTGKTPSLHNSRNCSENCADMTWECSDDWTSLWHSIIDEGILLPNPKFLPVNELPETEKEIVKISVEVANLFMRESMQFKLKDFYFSIAKHEYFEANPINPNRWELVCFVARRMPELNQTDAVDFILKLGSFIPELPRRCLEPMSLKFNCKRIIRKLLHLNWQLPYGIFKLNMPNSLSCYLNLETN